MRKFFPTILMLVAAVALTGCSVSKQFAKAATPLGDDIYADQIEYLDADTDADPSWRTNADAWIASVHAGEVEQVRSYWHGDDGVRAVQVHYLDVDPRRNEPGGIGWYQIKVGALRDFDFILSRPF